MKNYKMQIISVFSGGAILGHEPTFLQNGQNNSIFLIQNEIISTSVLSAIIEIIIIIISDIDIGQVFSSVYIHSQNRCKNEREPHVFDVSSPFGVF